MSNKNWLHQLKVGDRVCVVDRERGKYTAEVYTVEENSVEVLMMMSGAILSFDRATGERMYGPHVSQYLTSI